MARERYMVNIVCPNCGQSGKCQVSENDYPFMRKLDRNIKCVEGNFSASMKNEHDAKVVCGECGKEFEW